MKEKNVSTVAMNIRLSMTCLDEFEDYIEKYCPFCGEEQEVVDELEEVEKRYEDWN